MCYHNSLKKEAKEISEYYETSFDEQDLYKPIYHGVGFTFPQWPIVSNNAQKKIITLAEWGLIPSWAFDAREANHLRITNLNARSETIFEKASFKNAILQHRCLVPSTGYFEWQEVNKKKYPYFISLKNSELFSMAGIVNTWMEHETNRLVSSFAIITTEANACLAIIHNTKKRMPLILSRADENKWLNSQLSIDEIKQLMIPFPDNAFQYHTVNNLVSSFATKNSNIDSVSKAYQYPEFQQGSLF